jgi:predicted nuclease of predicted toxin-antitoxin system
MKLLLDANLSWKLTSRMKTQFLDCVNVEHIGLTVPITDMQIWNYAKKNDFVIVSNDHDFQNLSNSKGFPPKIILLRTGNKSTAYLEQFLLNHRAELEQFYVLAEQGCLEILSREIP